MRTAIPLLCIKWRMWHFKYVGNKQNIEIQIDKCIVECYNPIWDYIVLSQCSGKKKQQKKGIKWIHKQKNCGRISTL